MFNLIHTLRSKINSPRWVERLQMLFLLLISGGLRAYNLGLKSLWFDEAVLYWIAQGSFTDVIRQNAALNSAPPLYPFLVNLISYFGTSEAALRSISCLVGVLGVLAFFHLARQLVSRNAAFITSLFLSVALFHIEYSQELREYSTSFLLTVLLVYGYSNFVNSPDFRRSFNLIVVSIVSIFTQYGQAIVLVALNIHFLYELYGSRIRKRLFWRWTFIQVLSLVAVVIVYFIALRFQFTSTGFLHVDQGYWRGSISGIPSFLYRQTYDLILYFFLDPPVFMAGLIVGILYLLSNRSLWSKLTLMVLPFLMAMAFAIFEFYPYVGARQTLYLTPFLFLILAYGIDYILKVDKKGIIAISFVILILRTYGFQTYRYLQHPGTQNLRSLIELLESELESGDKVYVCPWGIPAFRYYYQESEKYLAGPVEGNFWKENYGTAMGADWQESLSETMESASNLWVVWVGQCGDKRLYTDFISERSEYEQIAVRDQAALFFLP